MANFPSKRVENQIKRKSRIEGKMNILTKKGKYWISQGDFTSMDRPELLKCPCTKCAWPLQ